LLKCLRHIELATFKENDAFTLVFHFAENEYIENTKINVSILCSETGDATEIKCDPIQWKEGKNITEKKIVKKQKNKRTGQQREVTKTEKQPSFFQLFESVKDQSEEEDEDEEEMMKGDLFTTNEDILNTIKESIIPYVVPAYFGVPIPELEEEDLDYDEDYEDEDDEDDDDEDDSPQAKKKGAKGGKGTKGKKIKRR